MRVDPAIKEALRKLPRSAGVYLFKDGQGAVIYVGKAKDLRNRVRAYFNPRLVAQDNRLKIRAMIRWIRRIETIVVKTEAEALILESRLLKEYKPKYNTDFVDDKRFFLIRVTADVLPRFLLVRNRIDAQSNYYGPFVHGREVKKLYFELRKRYGILISDVAPKKLADGKYQLYDDARGEIFEHANVVTREEYVERVMKASAFLEGKSRAWKEDVVVKMNAAAQAHRYEEAAKWRDLLQAIQFTRNPEKKFLRDPMLKILDSSASLEALQDALKMTEPPRVIECVDISHISGSFVVASLVRFADGKPTKDFYRRFKIRGDELTGPVNDDFAAMREVVGRYYRRLVDENHDLPSLIVIDGGAGQLKAALAAFIEHGIRPPMMIGLAKKNETFIFSDGRPPLTLPRTNEGLRLLQRVRDEAHRVANSFNAQWRAKQLKTTLLDDCPGIGPARKKLLFDKFKTLERLKRAPEEKLRKILGPKTAQVVRNYLLEKDAAIS